MGEGSDCDPVGGVSREHTNERVSNKKNSNESFTVLQGYTAVEQAVTYAPVTQWARIRTPIGTGFLGETNVRKL